MTRFCALLLLIPTLVVAQEKPKPAFVGVMIAAGKEKETIVVLGVLKDSPAAKGGLRESDVILKIDGAIPPDLQTAVKVIAALKPGRKAAFLIRRDGNERTIEVVPTIRDE